MRETTLQSEDTASELLFAAIELSNKKWKLALTARGRNREVTVPSGDLAGVLRAFDQAKERFGLDMAAQVISCYEAGRDGFWLHRALEKLDVHNLVVDSSSIEVDRRFRRAKTDRLDAWRLVRQLQRYQGGERRALRMVRVPSVEDEDARRPHRELERLRRERTGHSNRIRGLLALHGVGVRLGSGFVERLRQLEVDGQSLPAYLQAELAREYSRWELVGQQIRTLEAEQRQRLEKCPDVPGVHMARRLFALRGVGMAGASVFTWEFFAWRDFRNRRQVGAAVGLTPTPYASGDRQSEQGISDAGNRRVRATLIQIAWGWLRYQPDSALSQWFQKRFAGSPRSRRIGIVALARRLLIALWRYVRDGVVPEGARLKPVPTAA